MKSSTGVYYHQLDHIRAFATFLVFQWHYIHESPTPFYITPSFFIFAIFDEGHTGVALFMTLSGYIFSKILKNKKFHYSKFIFNRLLRVFPLLFFVTLIVAVTDHRKNILQYLFETFSKGLLIPSFPNGGWSVTVEMHFYILLPFLLIFLRKKTHIYTYLLVLILLRYLLWNLDFDIREYSYHSLIGRMDQFLLGIFIERFITRINNKIFILTTTLFLVFYYIFDLYGGYYDFFPHQHNFIWIFMPTIEGLFYAIFIKWYDENITLTSFPQTSHLLALIGTYSYSIYLLHWFFIRYMPDFISHHIYYSHDFYVNFIFGTIWFIVMVMIASISYHLIEKPFLKLRLPYIVK